MIRVLLLLATACSPRILRVPVSTTQDVRIVEMPSRASCYLEAPAQPPADIELNFDDENVITRTTVNIRQYNALLEWTRDLQRWMDGVRACLSEITGSEL